MYAQAIVCSNSHTLHNQSDVHPQENNHYNYNSVEHIPHAHIAQSIELLLCEWLNY